MTLLNPFTLTALLTRYSLCRGEKKKKKMEKCTELDRTGPASASTGHIGVISDRGVRTRAWQTERAGPKGKGVGNLANDGGPHVGQITAYTLHHNESNTRTLPKTEKPLQI